MKKTDKIFALAIDTSGRKGSLAIGQNGKILQKTAFSGMIRHSAEIFTATKKLLNEADIIPPDIQHVYVTQGPGSYTGLRIGATIAKMYAMANSAKIVSVSTMDVLAENAVDYYGKSPGNGPIITLLDAKRGSFFIAVYRKQEKKWLKTEQDYMISAEQLSSKLREYKETVHLIGEGLLYHQNKFTADNINIIPEKYWYPDASRLYHLAHKNALKGDFTNPKLFVPAYLRQPDAIEKSKRN